MIQETEFSLIWDLCGQKAYNTMNFHLLNPEKIITKLLQKLRKP